MTDDQPFPEDLEDRSHGDHSFVMLPPPSREEIAAQRDLDAVADQRKRDHEAPAQDAPPHDLKAEQTVIGSCLVDPDGLAMAASHVNAEDFYDATNKLAWQAAISLSARGAPIDHITVWQEMQALRPRGPTQVWLEHLFDTTKQTGATFAVEYHAKRIASLQSRQNRSRRHGSQA